MGKACYIGGSDGTAKKVKKPYVGFENFTPRALPSGYTQIEYIESSGTQYIDTGFLPNQDTRVEMSIGLEIPEACCVYGSRVSSSNSNFSVWLSAPNNVSCRFGAEAKETGFTVSGKIKIDQNKNISTVNGTVVTNTESTFQSTYPIFLFTLNDAGTYRSDRMTSGKLYYCKIYDNGTLVRDFVPCTNSDGTAGLYDMVSGTFYQNAGTGSFTAGTSKCKPVARKVRKIYIGDENGIARLTYSDEIEVTYTGNFTQEKVTMSGQEYLLLTLTSSGTLTLDDTVEADVWLCSGGSNGGTISITTTNCANGGDGGAFFQQTTTFKTANVVIGAAGGTSQFNDFSSVSAGSGAGGGGGKGAGSYISGSGGAKSSFSTLPFKDDYFTKYPCAGGGGGGKCYDGGYSYNGGGGGSSLKAGATGASGYSAGYGGAGGTTGGGDGGGLTQYQSLYRPSGNAATYYGSGGGGGGWYMETNSYGYGGNGYQGVCFVRIPLS